MSRRLRFLGGVLCLAGGYLVGFGAAGQTTIANAFNSFEGSLAAVPFLNSVEEDISTFEWFLLFGLVLFVLGVILATLGGGNRDGVALVTGQPIQKSTGPTCKFCGASMKDSTIYCPNCGKSQA